MIFCGHISDIIGIKESLSTRKKCIDLFNHIVRRVFASTFFVFDTSDETHLFTIWLQVLFFYFLLLVIFLASCVKKMFKCIELLII